MQQKHADKGLVVITVSLDNPEEKEQVEEANTILRKSKMPFANWHLTESYEFWSAKLDFAVPPCYYIFDRQGKWVRFRGEDYKGKEGIPYDEMDKVILKMLAEK